MPMCIPRGVSKMPAPSQKARWAFLDGRSMLENPYKIGTLEHIEWERSWLLESQDMEESIWALCTQRGRLGK